MLAKKESMSTLSLNQHLVLVHIGLAKTAISSLQSVSYTFTNADVSNWDVSRKQWAVTEGEYAVLVGASSQDIRLTGSFTV